MSTFIKIDLSSVTVKGIFPTILKTSFERPTQISKVFVSSSPLSLIRFQWRLNLFADEYDVNLEKKLSFK